MVGFFGHGVYTMPTGVAHCVEEEDGPSETAQRFGLEQLVEAHRVWLGVDFVVRVECEVLHHSSTSASASYGRLEMAHFTALPHNIQADE
jgi:hypothetical protein